MEKDIFYNLDDKFNNDWKESNDFEIIDLDDKFNKEWKEDLDISLFDKEWLKRNQLI